MSEAYPLRSSVSTGSSDRRRDILVFAACVDQYQFIFSDELIIGCVVYSQSIGAAIVGYNHPESVRSSPYPDATTGT